MAEPETWSGGPRGKRRRGYCPICGEVTAVHILIQARERTSFKATPTVRESRAVALCENHGKELFRQMHELMEQRRDGRD